MEDHCRFLLKVVIHKPKPESRNATNQSKPAQKAEMQTKTNSELSVVVIQKQIPTQGGSSTQSKCGVMVSAGTKYFVILFLPSGGGHLLLRSSLHRCPMDRATHFFTLSSNSGLVKLIMKVFDLNCKCIQVHFHLVGDGWKSVGSLDHREL